MQLVFLRLTLLFALVLLLMLRKLDLTIVLLVANLISVILFGVSLREFLNIFYQTVVSWDTWRVIGIVFLSLIFSCLMASSSLLNLMEKELVKIKKRRYAVLLAPVIIGLVPMPGGALLSAPLVEIQLKKENISEVTKTYINYWFRHIWEFFWPLYPGLILTSAISGIPIKTLMVYLFPLTIISIFIGLFFLRDESRMITDITNAERINHLQLLFSFLPIALITILIIVGIDAFIALLLTTLILIFIIIYKKRRITLKGFSAKILLIVFLIFLFKEIFIKSVSFPEIDKLETIFIILIATTIPFLTGFATGINQAYVGLSLPLIMSIIPLVHKLFYILIFYIAGYMGVLLSPVHFCLLLTKEYFNADSRAVYKKLIPSVLLVGLIGLVWVFLMTRF